MWMFVKQSPAVESTKIDIRYHLQKGGNWPSIYLTYFPFRKQRNKSRFQKLVLSATTKTHWHDYEVLSVTSLNYKGFLLDVSKFPKLMVVLLWQYMSSVIQTHHMIMWTLASIGTDYPPHLPCHDEIISCHISAGRIDQEQNIHLPWNISLVRTFYADIFASIIIWNNDKIMIWTTIWLYI